MKKQATQKPRNPLVLHRESLVRLDDETLTSIVGGCDQPTISCTGPRQPV